MPRFRKRSDTKRTQVPNIVPNIVARPPQSDTFDLLPELPPASDFRTSLILPDLTRRFTLLRNQTGDPLSLDDLRNRFADQRARGEENHITEEEENMILETLGRLRARDAADRDSSQESGEKFDFSSSIHSSRVTDADTSSLSGSVTSSRLNKRYSNNLFGSGRLRDYNPSRNGSSSTFKAGSTRSFQSSAHTDSSQNLPNSSMYSDEWHSPTPDSPALSSTESSPIKPRLSSLANSVPYGFQHVSGSESRSIKQLTPTALKRASLALERAIQDIEEEGEDEIVMPRSTPASKHTVPEAVAESSSQGSTYSDPTVEAGMAISVDRQVRAAPETHRVSPVPSRVTPGYIPGMPRPMTPRDHMESEEQRSHSTTPRATSPSVSSFSEATSGYPSGIIRRNQPSSRPTSPLVASHSPNENDIGFRSDTYTEFDSPSNSSLLTRRRPASPLSGPPYQPLAVSSRPGTPSNVIWSPPPVAPKISGHTRNGSWNSSFASSTISIPRLPDQRPFSPLSSIDATSPNAPSSHARSLTPTQNVSRSPISPSFPSFDSSSRSGSRLSSRQSPPSPMSTTKFPSLGFSPIANSSTSSLESAGSSYHSWDDGSKDRSYQLLNELDPSQPPWHDIPPDPSSSTTPGGSPEEHFDMEEVLARYAGLKKSDLKAIQDKLVSVAASKGSTSDVRERVPSLRRRRPSTSMSNHSATSPSRIASPPPPAQSSPPPTTSTSKADQFNALLNSVVDSIQSPPSTDSTASTTSTSTEHPIERTASNQSGRDISPTTRRNRDLAHVLFGEGDKPKVASPGSPSVAPPTSPEPAPTSPSAISVTPVSPSLSFQLHQRNPSTPRLPSSPEAQAELEKEVQRKAAAAMLALKKSPSQTNLNAGAGLLANNSVSRRRISPNQISTPKLVSASTSVDTIPLRSHSVNSGNFSSQSKISQRFKRFRGTLRSKPPGPLGGEITPFPLASSNVSPSNTSPNGQTATYDPAKLATGRPVPASATEFGNGKAKVLVPSPPASAGPGLKGFMARFRSKQRIPETHYKVEPRASPQPLSPPVGPMSPPHQLNSLSPSSPQMDADMAGQTPLASPKTPTTATIAMAAASERALKRTTADTDGSTESAALKQLFDAASNLGLDQNALSDLIRSASTSSRVAGWTPATRRVPAATEDQEPTRERVESPPPSVQPAQSRPSIDSQRPVDLAKKGSIRRNVDSHLRPSNGQDAANPVVRRTLIFPSDSRASALDMNALLRKSSSRRKRVSAQSYSSRSVHDRVPTPPPARSGARRFSTDASPPVPQLPASLPSQGDNLLPLPPSSASAIEKSTSTYESLFDMYASEKGLSTSPSEVHAVDHPQLPRNDTPNGPEAGTALEFIELANGETIWSIVNGLRDDDLDSPFTSRNSFASEYSLRENGDSGVQVFFKEHNRTGSKGSASSFLSRKKSSGKHRPETKVFYSSPTHIGRLIEDLSQGMDAGSFNFMPQNYPAQSTTSSLSEAQWTVEERLEHMLGSMNTK